MPIKNLSNFIFSLYYSKDFSIDLLIWSKLINEKWDTESI